MRLAPAFNLPYAAALVVNHRAAVSESQLPRWAFSYSGKDATDPTPDVLVLGTYEHPGTGNELVGGVNLNYLSRRQLEDLKRAIPEIAAGGDLKQRHAAGERAVPDVFSNYYRTYDSQHINAVQPGELRGWEAGGGKGNDMRYDDHGSEPVPGPAAAPPTPPAPGAGRAAARPSRGRGSPSPATPAPLPGTSVGPAMGSDPESDLEAQQAGDESELNRIAQAYRERAAQIAKIKSQKAERAATAQAQQNLERERQENLSALTTPNPGSGPDPLATERPPSRRGPGMESITYWDASGKRYVTEWVETS